MIRAEDLNAWLRGMEREEKAVKEGEEGHEGAGDTCRLFVRRCSTYGTKERSRGRCSCPWWY